MLESLSIHWDGDHVPVVHEILPMTFICTVWISSVRMILTYTFWLPLARRSIPRPHSRWLTSMERVFTPSQLIALSSQHPRSDTISSICKQIDSLPQPAVRSVLAWYSTQKKFTESCFRLLCFTVSTCTMMALLWNSDFITHPERTFSLHQHSWLCSQSPFPSFPDPSDPSLNPYVFSILFPSSSCVIFTFGFFLFLLLILCVISLRNTPPRSVDIVSVTYRDGFIWGN